LRKTRHPRRRPGVPRLEVGQRIRDVRSHLEGVVLDFACQYAHPKADPVHSYMVRWDDGQVTAISEAAIGSDFGVELVD
jgi:hypothetical protein